MNDQLKIEFEKFAYGGETIGFADDGKTVFTYYVLPGETALVKPYYIKKRYQKAALISIIKESEDRISPVCPHFTECGGCHYQHVNYDKQLQIKQNLVIDQLNRIGGISNPPVNKIVAAESQFNYRNSIQFQINENGELGFQAATSQQIIPISECHLPMEGIIQLWKKLDVDPFPGLRRVHFREGTNNDLMVLFESEDIQNLPELELDLPISVIHLSPGGTIVMAGDDHLVFQVKGKLFRVTSTSFFQVNTAQTEKMVEKTVSLLANSGKRLLELYCGVGLFTSFLAPYFEEVVAIEESESACEDFAINMDEFEQVSLYVGAAEEILSEISYAADCLLVDPPRSGLDLRVIDAIKAMNIPKIVYISCDTATFARDAKRLIDDGYELLEVTPFDMFPQTYHIEQIGFFVKS